MPYARVPSQGAKRGLKSVLFSTCRAGALVQSGLHREEGMIFSNSHKDAIWADSLSFLPDVGALRKVSVSSIFMISPWSTVPVNEMFE